jgi:hypothetical protein
VLLHQDRLPEALAAFAAIRQELETDQRGTRDDVVTNWTICAIVYFHCGDYARARYWVRRITQVLHDSPVGATVWALEAYGDIGDVCLGLWEAVNAGQAEGPAPIGPTRRLLAALRNYTWIYPMGVPRYQLYQGLAAWLRGQPARAHRAWQKSLAAARRLRLPYDTGRAHYEIGRHLPADHPARARHLARAVAIFARLPAVHHRTLAQVAQTPTRPAASPEHPIPAH